MDAQHTKHVTYKLAYHFVWCPKYRKKLLVGKLAAFVEQEIRRICEANTWTIGALNVQEDHVAHRMSTLDAVGSVLNEDGKGGYHFDRMAFKGPFDILGFFRGSMSGPLMAESTEEREVRMKRVVVLPESANGVEITL